MEDVDLRIRPVDQLLGEVAPFHHHHVNLWDSRQERLHLHSNFNLVLLLVFRIGRF